MNKKTKKEPASASFIRKMETPAFRKMALLGLISIVLIYDLLILGLGDKISRDSYSASPVQTIKNPWEKNVLSLVKGTPMEKMAPYISRREKKIAALLVSVAKKESNLGKRSPRLEGKDCYNYWGYRAKTERTTWDGYTCFSSPRQAVSVVAERMNKLVYQSKLDTPEKMVVWKCGFDCSWDNPVAVKKWVSDVDYYFQKFYE